MAKKKAKEAPLIDQIKEHIDNETSALDDDEYISFMEELESYASDCAQAKREELEDGTDDDDE